MLKRVFRHFLYSSEYSFKIERIGKTETALGYILVTNDTGKWVQVVEQIAVYLLKPHSCTYRHLVDITRLKEAVSIQ